MLSRGWREGVARPESPGLAPIVAGAAVNLRESLCVIAVMQRERRIPQDSMPQTVMRLVENLSDFKDWEGDVLRLSQEIAQEIGAVVLRAIDDHLMSEREEGLRLIGTRERTITTRFGPLKIERRLYRDGEGNYHFLLDEALELPPSKMRKAKRLILEADGVVVSLQRKKKKRKEVKLAFSYEGWEECSPGRFRTLEKTVHSGFSPTEEFWREFSVSLACRYDLSSVEDVVLGGDGASWVRGGNKLFPKSTYQLDRFHLARELKRALDAGSAKAAYSRACEGDLKAADKILAQAQEGAAEEEAEKIAQTRRYLASNREGLADWRIGREGAEDLRGLGTAEGGNGVIVERAMYGNAK